MGNTNSQEAAETQTVNYTHGHHVIKITPGSPGDKGGLIPFFDYLVEANGVVLDKDSVLVELLTQSVGKELKFIVYNTKKEDIREVVINASDWGEQTRLGVSVRFAELKPNMMDYVWHVLEVSANSPASDAGLIEDHDYIVGTTKSGFTDSDDFYTLIDQNHHKPIELYVYNVAADQVRTVILTPNPSWGGSGSLGCDVGYGLIHRIPSEESRRKLLGVSNDTPLKRNVIRQSNSPPPSPSPQPISQIPSPLQSQYQPPLQPSIQLPIQPSFQTPIQTPIQYPVQSPVQIPVQSPVPSPVQYPVVPVQSPIPSPVVQSPLVHSPVSQSPIGQSPVSQSPIGQSPLSQSPIGQSPVSQSPISQSPVNQSPISSPITTPHSQLPLSPLPNQTPISISTPLPSTPLASQNFPSPVPSPLSSNLPSISSIQSPSPSPLSPSISFPLSPPVPTTPINFPPSPFPSTPITLPANSPSLETLQALKDKQAKLQEQLKSLQSTPQS